MTIPHRRCHRCRAVAYGSDVLKHKVDCEELADERERQYDELDKLTVDDPLGLHMRIVSQREELAALRAQLAIAVEALEEVQQVGSDRIRTHWDGCASVHPLCRVSRIIETALAKLKEAGDG